MGDSNSLEKEKSYSEKPKVDPPTSPGRPVAMVTRVKPPPPNSQNLVGEGILPGVEGWMVKKGELGKGGEGG